MVTNTNFVVFHLSPLHFHENRLQVDTLRNQKFAYASSAVPEDTTSHVFTIGNYIFIESKKMDYF